MIFGTYALGQGRVLCTGHCDLDLWGAFLFIFGNYTHVYILYLH